MQRLGFLPTEISEFHIELAGYQRNVDAMIAPGSIVFIGDSIVQNLCVPCVSGQAFNFGIGGDTTLGVLSRIKTYQSVRHAKTVVLSVGTNDLVRRSSDDILGNYIKILESIPGSVNVILMAIFPVDAQRLTGRYRSNAVIGEINVQLERICDALSNCVFSNLGSQLTNESGNLDEKFHTGDGLHLNADAYQYWIAELRKLI